MMSTTQKSQFIAESLAKAIEKDTNYFLKSIRKHIKSEGEMDNNKLRDYMLEAAIKSTKSMDRWEEKSFPELDGLTPKQYFESLSSINDIIEIVALLEEKNQGLLPTGLSKRIKALDDTFSDDLLNALESIQLGAEKFLSTEQKAIIHIASILALPKFVNGLIRIIYQLDEEKTDRGTFLSVMDALIKIGEPALEPLINVVEDGEKEGRLYEYLIIIIGKIASKNKSERVYRLLKDCFRKSETKSSEAFALSLYGDGRAIPAIRGYVERNSDNLSYREYLEFRKDVLSLGGDMSDLDEYFDYYDEFGEEFDEEFDEFEEEYDE